MTRLCCVDVQCTVVRKKYAVLLLWGLCWEWRASLDFFMPSRSVTVIHALWVTDAPFVVEQLSISLRQTAVRISEPYSVAIVIF